MVHGSGPHDPDQPPLHRPRGVEQAAQDRAAHRRRGRRPGPRDQADLEPQGGVDLLQQPDAPRTRQQGRLRPGPTAPALPRAYLHRTGGPHQAPVRPEGHVHPCPVPTTHAGQLEQQRRVLPVPLPQRVRTSQQHRPRADRVRPRGRRAASLDHWLAQSFAPDRVDVLRRAIADCDRNLPCTAPPWKPAPTPSSSRPGRARSRPSPPQPHSSSHSSPGRSRSPPG